MVGWSNRSAGMLWEFGVHTGLLVRLNVNGRSGFSSRRAPVAVQLLGWAAYHRVSGVDSPGWLVLSPVILTVAIADPNIFSALIHTGEGWGSLGVVMTALAAGDVLSRHRWSLARVAAALLAALDC